MLRHDHPATGPASTFSRVLLEERNALVGWGVGIAASVVLELALFPTVRSNDLSHLLDSYPEAMKRLFSVSDFTTGAGFIRTELFSLVVPMLFVVLGILWGSDAVAGEEQRNTLDLLLANPISRRRFLLEKAGGVTAGLLAVGAATLAALTVGDAAFSVGVGFDRLAAATAGTVLLATGFALVALVIGAATGHRGAARGIAAATAVAAYLLSSLAPLVGWLEPWRVVSPWYQALGVDPIAEGFSPAHSLLLVVGSLLVLGLGVTAFERRDLVS